ncbi:hypothetical protein BC936DRAFT_142518, partial [Jimgerdemannia flammicorona]
MTFPTLATHPYRRQIFSSSPGYLPLSSFFLGKIDALLHRQIFAVTTVVQFDPSSSSSDPTIPSQYSAPSAYPSASSRLPLIGSAAAVAIGTTEFPTDRYPRHQLVGSQAVNASAAAAAAGALLQNGKPRVLEMASRRFAECIVMCARAGDGLFGEVLGAWVKAAVERTRVYEVESVFCEFYLFVLREPVAQRHHPTSSNPISHTAGPPDPLHPRYPLPPPFDCGPYGDAPPNADLYLHALRASDFDPAAHGPAVPQHAARRPRL